MSLPRIGLTAVTRTVSGAERTLLNAAYVRAVLLAGGIPLILSPLIPPEQAGQVAEGLDGLVLTGGEDVDPAYFGQEPHPRLGPVDRVRDALELAMFREAWSREIPVLGICRGIQLLNVALGGTLWQDIPSERPAALTHAQPDARDARTHTVTIAPGSRLAQALGTVRCDVNSFHHQSIREPARALTISARAPDGEIEGVESGAGTPWLLAVQWHPEEFHHHPGAPDHGLFRALVQQAELRAAAGLTSPVRLPE